MGCRKISDLVKKKFGISIGKSRIAWLLKSEGISSPVGRRRKRPYLRIRVLACEGLGNYFLKCADLSLKGISSLTNMIKKRFSSLSDIRIQAMNETLFYLRLLKIGDLEEIKKMGGLPELIPKISGKNYRYFTLASYHKKLQGVRTLNLESFSRFASSLEEGLYLKFLLLDNHIFYLDAKMHSIWSESNIPFDFSSGINKVQEYLSKCFLQNNQPLVLQSCPGYDSSTKEFFFFLRAMEKDARIKNISLYSQELKLLDFEPIESKKRYFILGLWPWQYRKVRQIKELPSTKNFSSLIPKEQFQISEAEVELTEPKSKQSVKLKAGILRSKEKIRIIILTNIFDRSIEEITLRYLERWPNLEEGFEDFSKKKELYTYKEVKKITPIEIEFSPTLELGEIHDFWLKNLSCYCQRHFFPLEYRNLDFSEVKRRFYDLSGNIEKRKGLIFINLFSPKDYSYLKDLLYSCKRVNESDITTPKGERIYFEISL